LNLTVLRPTPYFAQVGTIRKTPIGDEGPVLDDFGQSALDQQVNVLSSGVTKPMTRNH
jgi:hypothetical protein